MATAEGTELDELKATTSNDGSPAFDSSNSDNSLSSQPCNTNRAEADKKSRGRYIGLATDI